MIKRILLLIVSCLLFIMVVPTFAAQPLPGSAWYAVVYEPETNTLRWINADGEQASMPRPTLPNEVEYVDMRISPDGQTMVLVSLLNNGLQGIGIYSFASGTFVQAHQAQPGETINLGGSNIFTANSQSFAVGFYSGDFANPAWRVILFETQTGDAIAFIDHTHPDAPEAQLSAPAVQYLDGVYVHFQLIPQAVGGWHTWPAYAWRVTGFDPNAPLISESPYTRDNTQILPLTGQTVMSYLDDGFVAAPQDGQTPNFNAIGTAVLAINQEMVPVHADGTRYHLLARWANAGQWILFLSDDSQGNRYWNIVLSNGTPGNNSHMPFDPQFIDAYGTSNGYLVINNSNGLFYSNGFLPNTALNIAQLTPNSDIVYVTPIGISFLLQQIPSGGQLVAGVTPPPAQPQAPVVTPVVTVEPQPEVVLDCSLAPQQRVGIGSGARVVPSMGGLNLRQNPNGAILMTLSGGDEFSVIGGPICDNGLYWWQIQRSGTNGWLAEGNAQGYYIEPYVAPPPPVEPEPVTEVPPVVQACGNALAPRLTIGRTATVTTGLRPLNGPGGQPVNERLIVLEGTLVTVNAGPECSGGQNWWLITGQGKIGRIGQQFETVQGWVPESTSNTYNLAP